MCRVRLHGSGFARNDLQAQPLPADDLDRRSRVDRFSRRRGLPERAANEDEALGCKVLPGLARSPTQRLGSGGRRPATRDPAALHEEDEETEAAEAGPTAQHWTHPEHYWAGGHQ